MRFIFTHIEKCAGTSFKEYLGLTFLRYVHVSKNFHGGNDKRNDLTKNQLREIKKLYPSGIGGHSVRPYLNFIDFKKNFTIIFLRNPVERYMSQYNHDRGMGFTKNFKHFLSRSYMNNFMVNKIVGVNDLDRAIKLLDQFSFVGDTNRYAQSLHHLSKLLGKKFYGLEHFKNVRKSNKNYLKFEDLSEENKTEVLKQNDLDIKLYDYFLSKSDYLNQYPTTYDYKKPSNLRIKIFNKIGRMKKKKMVEIRKNII
jgi:hypothetical protein